MEWLKQLAALGNEVIDETFFQLWVYFYQKLLRVVVVVCGLIRVAELEVGESGTLVDVVADVNDEAL